ncbi:putative 2-oxoglutarate-dependent dioxygenase AOP1 [Trifolium repens]|nr:putative 2-oxoglutarate-dependent dioxygenase AOP1 [Trifolium repens]
MGSETESQIIPVVDFSDQNMMKPDTNTWLSACNVVRTSLEDYGCFVAKYDKVGKDLCNFLVSSIEELIIWSPFGLETKKQKTSDRPFYVASRKS